KGGTVAPAGVDLASLDWGGFAGNLMPVTLGNIFGGSVMVALVYYLIYRRGLKS
ncbi:MAG: formate/nitrite transporter family protein, partial [Betaproteobacteria bacterium]|nr:formate/nitrite transporter family protein [Betaproteobacteria bacterium]